MRTGRTIVGTGTGGTEGGTMTQVRTRLMPDLLLAAYATGIFPMADSHDSDRIWWMDPPERGILPLDGFHVSRSLARRIRRGGYRIRRDSAFEQVLDGCADRPETWISRDLRRAYLDLHRSGHAHSFEIWHGPDLTGGMYGVALGGAFFGESMFSRRTDASKLVLAHATDHLRRCGFALFDTQYLTDHLASLGAVEIPRDRYRARLARALALKVSVSGGSGGETVENPDIVAPVLERVERR